MGLFLRCPPTSQSSGLEIDLKMSSAVLYILALFLYFNIFLSVFALRFFAVSAPMFKCLLQIILVTGGNSVDRTKVLSSKPREGKQR